MKKGIAVVIYSLLWAFTGLASNFLLQAPQNEELNTLGAGISAYVDVGRSLDLDKAKKILQGIQAEEESYVIGIVSLESLPEDQWPHVYISKDGWIVAYYPSTEPASKLFYWAKYDGGKITTTTLEEAVRVVSQELFRAMRLPLTFAHIQPEIHYYDFRYPGAKKLLIVSDTVKATDPTSNDELQYIIPKGLMVLEASWILFGKGLCCGSSAISFKINDEHIAGYKGGGSYYIAEVLSGDFLIPTLIYKVHLYAYDYHNNGLGGIALIFIYFTS